MRIESLTLTDFRNLRRMDLRPGPAVTVLAGRNAVGKTNVLEAVSLVTKGSSFRRAEWKDLVRRTASSARVALRAEGETGGVDVDLRLTADGARTWVVNGKNKRSSGGLANLVPSVTFTPDDLGLVKGPADVRRSALDALGGSLSEAYARTARDYARALRHRNALLRESPAETTELDVWDERVAELGGRLTSARGRLLARLAPLATSSMRGVSDEGLEVGYEDKAGSGDGVMGGLSAEEIGALITDALRARRKEELARGMTLAGPHRDDVTLRVGGSDARTMASQGQQRTVVLAWKLAEVRLVREISGRPPIVLLDDVMSELDECRRDALTALAGSGNQTIITTTNLGYFSELLLADAEVVRMGDDG